MTSQKVCPVADSGHDCLLDRLLSPDNIPREVRMPNRINALFVLEDTLIAYAAGDAGLLLKSEDGGALWRRLNSGVVQNLYMVYFPGQGAVGYACGDQGVVVKTEDAGSSWYRLSCGLAVDLRAVRFPISPQVGFVAGDRGTILRTADGGATWEKLTTATEHKIMDMNFPSDELVGYAVGVSGTLLKTTTGGTNWFSLAGNVQGLTSGVNFTAVHFPAGDTVGFMTSSDGRVFFTPAAGELWRPQNTGRPLPPLYSLDMRHDTMAGFCVGGAGTVIHTENGGEQWELLDAGVYSDFFSVRFFADGVRGIIAGDSMTLLFTLDGGNSWAPAEIVG